jgi:capsular polysaccharide biosynthesis protein
MKKHYVLILTICPIVYSLPLSLEQFTNVPKTAITIHELKEKNPHSVLFIGDEEILNECTYEYASNFVAELDYGRIYEDGIIITKDNHLLADTTIMEWGKTLDTHHIFTRNELPLPRYIPGRVAVLASPGAQCYYHWLFQILPRLELLEKSSISYDSIYLMPMNEPFQLETLLLIGLHNKKVIFGKLDEQIVADTLIVPAIPTRGDTFSPWVCNFIRGKMLRIASPIENNYNIYISRKNAQSRRIINEEEIIELLQAFNFKTVFLEDLSIQEQITIMSSAKTIITPHGSALANVVFCNPETHVIEIFNEHCLTEMYKNLCISMNIHHHALITSSDNLNDEQIANDDLHIAPQKLFKILMSILK